MRQLIVGNWKMNGRLDDVTQIVGPLRHGADGLACDLVVCPPATVLHAVAHILVGSTVEAGGQDCHAEPSGPHTGDISAAMLRDVGARWVILGHSERRARYHETDAEVLAKVRAAEAAGLNPIVCVGETQADREAGRALDVVRRQVHDSLPPEFSGTVAYEPIWAIGTGQVPDAEAVIEMQGCIRALVAGHVRILYGGSVKPSNAASFLGLPHVDGALVGGSSLIAADFLAIAGAAVAASP